MKYGLPRKQQEVYDFIEKINKSGSSPSYEEIAKACNMKARSQAFYSVEALIKKGMVRKLPNAERSIVIIKD